MIISNTHDIILATCLHWKTICYDFALSCGLESQAKEVLLQFTPDLNCEDKS